MYSGGGSKLWNGGSFGMAQDLLENPKKSGEVVGPKKVRNGNTSDLFFIFQLESIFNTILY